LAPALTPVAVRSGRILSERLFNGKENLKCDYEHIPTVIFSHPPIGTVGLSEELAIKEYGADNISSYKSEFTNMFYSLMEPNSKNPERPKSLFKLICHKEKAVGTQKIVSEKVVGVHTIGRAADEMMQACAIAVKMGATKQDFDNTVAIHPTASEELVLMDTKYV
jgi:glutathione reductase (NADPH)